MGWYEEESRRLDRMMEEHRKRWRLDSLILCLGAVLIIVLSVAGLFLVGGK